MAERGSRTGIFIVIGVVVIGLGAIAAWLFWWTPKQEREAAQAQVKAWEARWMPARTCILGDPPLAADPADALALSELASGSLASTAADCTDVVARITRPEGEATTDEVEAAFAEVQAAIPAVAQAYAFRISSEADEVDRRVAELGVALTAMDAAHDRLRAVAGLAALDRGGGAVLHRLPEPTALVVDQRPLPLENASRIQAGVIEGARFGDYAVFFAMTAPGEVREVRSAVDALHSMPDGAWMAGVLPARAFDQKAVDGQLVPVAMPAADTFEHAAAVPVGPVGFVPVAALGTGDERAVVLAPDASTGAPVPAGTASLELAVSKDAGKTWTPARWKDLVVGFVQESDLDLVRGTVDLVIRSVDERRGDQWFRFDPARPAELPAPVEVSELDLTRACRRGGTVWWLASSGVYRLAAPEVTPAPLPEGTDLRVLDCTADAALVEDGSVPVRYHRCQAGACTEVFRGSTYAYGRAAMLDDGAVVYAAGRGAVIALWKEGSPDPTYFRAPRPFTLDALVVWKGVPHALGHAPDDPARLLTAVPLAAP